MRGLEIQDHMYDIKKLQRERKYEGQSKVKELRINGKTHKGTVKNKAVEKEMKKELHCKCQRTCAKLSAGQDSPSLRRAPAPCRWPRCRAAPSPPLRSPTVCDVEPFAQS